MHIHLLHIYEYIILYIRSLVKDLRGRVFALGAFAWPGWWPQVEAHSGLVWKECQAGRILLCPYQFA